MAPTWDERLISPERAMRLVLGTELYLDVSGGVAHLRHVPCNQSVGMFWQRDCRPMTTSPDDLIAAILRHMVMAHDQPLSGVANERDNGDDTDGGSVGGPASPDRGPAAGPVRASSAAG
jgi:hypothetical protein